MDTKKYYPLRRGALEAVSNQAFEKPGKASLLIIQSTEEKYSGEYLLIGCIASYYKIKREGKIYYLADYGAGGQWLYLHEKTKLEVDSYRVRLVPRKPGPKTTNKRDKKLNLRLSKEEKEFLSLFQEVFSKQYHEELGHTDIYLLLASSINKNQELGIPPLPKQYKEFSPTKKKKL